MPTYRPEIFEVENLDAAMRIILTAEKDITTEERWEYETHYLIGEIGRVLELNSASRVIDYGCGVGRLAKGLIERYGCFVLGVDISLSMRQLAPRYVGSERFAACSPEWMVAMTENGFRATHACACWIIQHSAAPDEDLARIDAILAEGGSMFVLNNDNRCVPTDQGWINDGISVEELLMARFDKISKGSLPEVITTPEIANNSYTMTVRKRK